MLGCLKKTMWRMRLLLLAEKEVVFVLQRSGNYGMDIVMR